MGIDMGDDAVRGNAADTTDTDATDNAAERTDVAGTVVTDSVGGTDTAHSSLVTDIVQICHNNNATDIARYHLRSQTRIADTVVIATVGSARIMDSLLQDIRICLQSHQHMPSHGIPRHDKSGWVAIDCGSTLVHLVAKEQREYYELDALYQ